jgi:predicted PurR-regulated permease PerM
VESTAPGQRDLLRVALAVLAVAVLLWVTREVLAPPIVFGVVWVALHPFRDHDGITALLITLGLITGLWVLATTGGILAPFLVAMGLAYLLDPLVDRVEARGVGRTSAILLLAVPAIIAISAIVVFALPALGRQGGEFIRDLPALVERLQTWGRSFEAWLAGMPGVGGAIADRLHEIDGDAVAQLLAERQAALTEQGWQAVLGVGRGLGAALALLGYAVITPVIAFYLLRDWDSFIARLEDLLPRERHEQVMTFAREYDDLLGRYLRGQITVAVAMGALTALALWAWQFPYAFLIGGLVTVFSVVPYLGLLLSLLPAIAVALTSGAVGYSLVKVAVVFGVVQTLEGTVISPRIVGDSVGLHPVWVVLALSAGGYYLGFVGLLLAVPIASGIKLVVVRLVDRYHHSRIYDRHPNETEPEPGA